MLQTPPAPHSAFSEQPEGLRISIPPPRQLFPAVFLLVWLIGWYFGFMDVGRRVVRDPLANLFETIWLCGWTLGGGWALSWWVWNLFGSTVLTVRPDSITLHQSVFGLGRTRVFATNEMFNLRFIPEYGSGKRRRASHIAFDFGAKAVKIASEIQEPEANLIIHTILERAAIRTAPSYTTL